MMIGEIRLYKNQPVKVIALLILATATAGLKSNAYPNRRRFTVAIKYLSNLESRVERT